LSNSGGGGIDSGAQAAQLPTAAGYKFVSRWCCDVDAHSIETIKENFPEAMAYDQPMEEFLRNCRDSKRGYPQRGDVFLATMGLPCQGLSKANIGRSKHREMTDPRNVLFRVGLELVEQLRPPYLLVEEVPGFLRDEQIDTLEIFKKMQEAFGDDGCGCCSKCSNAMAMAFLLDDEVSASQPDPPPSSQPTLTQPQRGGVTRSGPKVHQNCVGDRLETADYKQQTAAALRYGKPWLQKWRQKFCHSLPMLVPGLEMIEELEKVGYRCTVGIHQVAQFGVPQRRCRAIILGTDVKAGWELAKHPAPTHRIDEPYRGGIPRTYRVLPVTEHTHELKAARTVGDALELGDDTDPAHSIFIRRQPEQIFGNDLKEGWSGPFNHYCVPDAWPNRSGANGHLDRKLVEAILPGESFVDTHRRLQRLDGIDNAGTNNKDLAGEFKANMGGAKRHTKFFDAGPQQKLPSFVTGNSRSKPTEQFRTIITDISRDHDLKHVHPTEHRGLTLREMCRAQAVPDSHRICSVSSVGAGAVKRQVEAQFQQVGNWATTSKPVPLTMRASL
jgi:site-specific DNA-cytosine methylase